MKSFIPCAGVLLSAFLCLKASAEDNKLFYLKANEKNAPAVYAITNNSSWTASDGSVGVAGPLDETATYCVKNNWYLRTLPYGVTTAFTGGELQIGEPSSQGRLIIYGGNDSSPLSFEGSQRGLSIVYNLSCRHNRVCSTPGFYTSLRYRITIRKVCDLLERISDIDHFGKISG